MGTIANKILVILVLAIIAACDANVKTHNEIPRLPDCSSTLKPDPSGRVTTILISTLDGKLSAFQSTQGDWEEKWSNSYGDGPLVTSTVNNVRFYQRGIPQRLIPSLHGQLFSFDGKRMEPLPVTAESLLSSSYKIGDDLLVSGKKESRSFGVHLSDGGIEYECGFDGCQRPHEKSENESAADELILVERFTQGVRAHDPRNGKEQWNLFASEYKISLLNTDADCWSPPGEDEDMKFLIRFSLPKSEIEVIDSSSGRSQWRKKFSIPVANVWLIKDGFLASIDPFTSDSSVFPESPDPLLFLGRYSNQGSQLYVQMSPNNHQTIPTVDVLPPSDDQKLVVFKPTKSTRSPNELVSVERDLMDISSVGLFLYKEVDDNKKCSANDSKTINIEPVSDSEYFGNSTNEESFNEIVIVSLWHWWREIAGLSILLAVIINLVAAYLKRRVKECISPPRSPETSSSDLKRDFLPESDPTTEHNPLALEVCKIWKQLPRSNSLSSKTITPSSPTPSLPSIQEVRNFESHFLKEFNNIECLGKGGFGHVFKAQRKLDGRSYAIKRIRLPSKPEARDKVMREVKALANLDHQHIVRYFYSWLEDPPFGWQEEKDKELLTNLTQASVLDSTNHKTFSTSPVKPSSQETEHQQAATSTIETEEDSISRQNVTSDLHDSYVVFENSSKASTSKRAKDLDDGDELIPQIPTSVRHTSPKTYLYIQMELCEKYTLREWLLKTQVREKDSVMDIFRQITQAVEYVHGSGLMHRDLKPSNIFFSVDRIVKVGDFGLVTEAVADADLATRNSSEADLPSLESLEDSGNGTRIASREGDCHTGNVGTCLYMSPEQMKGSSYSNKVDVFSLGVIFFELLEPFRTDMERLKTLTEIREHIFPNQFVQKHEHEFELLKKLLAHKPEERPSVIEILEHPLLAQRTSRLSVPQMRRRTISVTDGDMDDMSNGGDYNI